MGLFDQDHRRLAFDDLVAFAADGGGRAEDQDVPVAGTVA